MTPTKKILIIGSKEFNDGQILLDAINAEAEWDLRLIVIQGAHEPVDAMAHTISASLPGMLSVSVPADWDNDGESAGQIRNLAMLDLNPDVILAFLEKETTDVNTQHCIDEAEKRGLVVKVFRS